MKALKSTWQETKKRFNKLEDTLIDCYINFLKEITRTYLKSGRRVFFKENKMVHWGEGGFGNLTIEGRENAEKIFGEHIPEINFLADIKEGSLKGYVEINSATLNSIKYERS